MRQERLQIAKEIEEARKREDQTEDETGRKSGVGRASQSTYYGEQSPKVSFLSGHWRARAVKT